MPPCIAPNRICPAPPACPTYCGVPPRRTRLCHCCLPSTHKEADTSCCCLREDASSGQVIQWDCAAGPRSGQPSRLKSHNFHKRNCKFTTTLKASLKLIAPTRHYFPPATNITHSKLLRNGLSFFGPSLHSLLSAESQPFMIITLSFVLIALTFLSSTSTTFSPFAKFVCFSGASPPVPLSSAAHPPSGLFACPLQISIGTRSSSCTTSMSPVPPVRRSSRYVSCFLASVPLTTATRVLYLLLKSKVVRRAFFGTVIPLIFTCFSLVLLSRFSKSLHCSPGSP